MFKENRKKSYFNWNDIGKIEKGRPNLGNTISVSIYRLMQYTLRDTIIKFFDPETASKVFYDAGFTAGVQFCKEMLDKKKSLSEFLAHLQKTMKDLNIGIIRIEKLDIEKLDITLSIEEDLDCSGLPIQDETVCDYDEGFIAGILKEYTGFDFSCKEIDCWASGARTCRFDIHLE